MEDADLKALTAAGAADSAHRTTQGAEPPAAGQRAAWREERAHLIEKNEMARLKVESMISRLKAPSRTHDPAEHRYRAHHGQGIPHCLSAGRTQQPEGAARYRIARCARSAAAAVIGADRVAVMAALNITHELLHATTARCRGQQRTRARTHAAGARGQRPGHRPQPIRQLIGGVADRVAPCAVAGLARRSFRLSPARRQGSR